MLDSLHTADRKLRRLRRLYAASVVVGGMAVVLNLALGVTALALAATAVWPGPGMVLPVAKALLSTLAAVASIYLVAVPLYRNLPLPRFVAYLERVVGRETYLLSAVELLRDSRREPARFSGALLERVGAAAVADLRPLGPGSLRAVRALAWHFSLFVLLLGGSLALNMAAPEQIAASATRLLTAPPAPVPVSEPGPRAPARRAGVQAARPAPPCRAVTVLVTPPAYLQRESYALAWGGRATVVAGSAVEVRCLEPAPEARLDLALEGSAGTTRRPLDSGPGTSTDAEALTATAELTESGRLLLTGSDGRAMQPGALILDVAPDEPPQCTLVQPAQTLEVKPGGSVSLLAQAGDDFGLAVVTVRYRVEGLDSVPTTIELARPDGARRSVVQRDLPISSFGADPTDTVLLHVEVTDANDRTGPGRCTTRTVRLNVASPHGAQRRLIERLTGLRDAAVDRIGEGALQEPDDEEARTALQEKLQAYARELEESAGAMARMSLFKQEDVRRVATLAASFEPLLAPAGGAEEAVVTPRQLQAAVRELEQHAIVLDGLVEKLQGEYLFHVSGRVQSELNRLLRLSREAALDETGRRALRRGVRRLHRTASRAVAFKQATQPRLPVLLTSAVHTGQSDAFARIADLSRVLAEGGEALSGEAWKNELEALSLAVERAAQSVEGAYARSMTRLSTSFKNAQSDLTRRLRTALALNQALHRELGTLIVEVQRETKEVIKRRKTIEGARDVARTGRKLARRARRFRAGTYPKVDSSQVVEFRERLERLLDQMALLKLEEASALAQELVTLTNSMEFSLRLSIRYAKDADLVERSRTELGKVKEARRLVEQIVAKLSVIRPQRQKLRSLRSEKLEELFGKLERLQVEVAQVREKVEALNKLFPIFFGKFGPQLDRVAESLGQARQRLQELMLEDTARLTGFVDESLGRLLAALENATRSARSASALAAGGAQPALELEGKEETMSRERLERYLEHRLTLGEKREWQDLINAYFEQLSP